MIHITLVLEDTVMVADLRPVEPMDNHEDKPWSVVCCDTFKGKSQESRMSNRQMAAILALAIAGDEAPANELLYTIAEEALAGWDREVRPIP